MKIDSTPLESKNLSMSEIERYAHTIGGEISKRFLKFEGAWVALMQEGAHWSEVEHHSEMLKKLRQELDL